MNNITEEINKIAEEMEVAVTKLSTSITPSSRMEKLSVGTHYYELIGLQYSLLRFYPLAIQEQLTEKAKTFYTELMKSKTLMEEMMKEKEDAPKELTEFLNKKTNGHKE